MIQCNILNLIFLLYALVKQHLWDHYFWLLELKEKDMFYQILELWFINHLAVFKVKPLIYKYMLTKY